MTVCWMPSPPEIVRLANRATPSWMVVSMLVLMGLGATGCGPAPAPSNAAASSGRVTASPPMPPTSPPAAQPARPKTPAVTSDPLPPQRANGEATTPREGVVPRRTLGELLTQEQRDAMNAAPPPARMPLSAEDAAAAGLRRIASKHLTLYTDLPAQPAIDELPSVFDRAVPQWCAYFEVPAERTEKWRQTAYIMRDADRFRQIDALPGSLPPFLHGFQLGHEIWVHEQESDYYRRHLLLHEGTHGFMVHALGGMGPPWYSEGMAELLGTHRWADGQLTLNYVPRTRDEVPLWGRIKILQSDFRAGRGKTLLEVFAYDGRAHLAVEPYGWSWAAALFLDRHPLTKNAFRAAQLDARDNGPEFSRRMIVRLGPQWEAIQEDWQLFVVDADYGYDVARAAVIRKAGEALPEGGATVKLQANLGWQSTGIRLEAGQNYRIRARGRYVIAREPELWWCEPSGVTLRYYQHQPAGIVLGAVAPDTPSDQDVTPLARPLALGLERVIPVARSGTLYVRINEPSGQLSDNEGEFLVRVEQSAATP